MLLRRGKTHGGSSPSASDSWQVGERLKPRDCKSRSKRRAGSNPALPTPTMERVPFPELSKTFRELLKERLIEKCPCGLSLEESVAEHGDALINQTWDKISGKVRTWFRCPDCSDSGD